MAKFNDPSNTEVKAIPDALVAHKAGATIAPDAAIVMTREALDIASLATQWSNDRIMPLIQALAALAEYSGAEPHLTHRRLELIRGVANEADNLINEMAGQFEHYQRELEAKLQQPEGGAQ